MHDTTILVTRSMVGLPVLATMCVGLCGACIMSLQTFAAGGSGVFIQAKFWIQTKRACYLSDAFKAKHANFSGLVTAVANKPGSKVVILLREEFFLAAHRLNTRGAVRTHRVMSAIALVSPEESVLPKFRRHA